jgi:hypothetical protein
LSIGFQNDRHRVLVATLTSLDGIHQDCLLTHNPQLLH